MNIPWRNGVRSLEFLGINSLVEVAMWKRSDVQEGHCYYLSLHQLATGHRFFQLNELQELTCPAFSSEELLGSALGLW
jgi:hypothetical protein